MALAKKHLGFGKWAIIDDAGAQVAGPFLKNDADEYLQNPPRSKVNEIDEERKYQRRIDEMLRKPVTADLAKLKAVLAKSEAGYTAIEQELILGQFETILRHRGRFRRRSHNTVLQDAA